MVVLILISLSDEALGTQGEVATWLPQTCSSWSGLRFWQWPHCVSPCQHSQSCAVTCLSLPAPCPFGAQVINRMKTGVPTWSGGSLGHLWVSGAAFAVFLWASKMAGGSESVSLSRESQS